MRAHRRPRGEDKDKLWKRTRISSGRGQGQALGEQQNREHCRELVYRSENACGDAVERMGLRQLRPLIGRGCAEASEWHMDSRSVSGGRGGGGSRERARWTATWGSQVNRRGTIVGIA
jgi:hypothetical protein